MIRLSTIFVAFCMVLIAAALGFTLRAVLGIGVTESAVVALCVLMCLLLYHAVSARLNDRSRTGAVGDQITELSRGTDDLARQVAEFGRRLAVIEGRMAATNSAGQDRLQTVMGEISELGTLVRQLAGSVANHDDILTAKQTAALIATAPAVEEAPVVPSAGHPSAAPPAPLRHDSSASILTAVKSAIASGRIDIYLQPMVTLPQRKVRFYEAVSRLRDENDQILTAEAFIGTAEVAGLMGRIDHAVMLRCMQVLRRLMVRNKDVGVFCNVAAATLGHAEAFGPCLDFLEANRALAGSFILEFKQSTIRELGPVESRHLAELAQRGYRFSIDNVTDLRFEPRELADRGVRFIKVPAALLLDQRRASASDIAAADLSDLLGRFGIDLIAERIEGERAVVDLLDHDVRFGQGFLFSPPRPLRPEALSATASPAATGAVGADKIMQDANAVPTLFPADNMRPEAATYEPPRVDPPPRLTGNAALARRAPGPG